MINNFEIIKPLLEFEEGYFYFLQILQRKKDHKEMKVNGSNNNSRLIKAYYIHSMDYLNFIEKEVIAFCDLFQARASINLNRRNYHAMSLHLLRKVADQIMNKSYDKSHAAYTSVVGAYSQDTDKKWVLDFDEFLEDDEIERYKEYLTKSQPIGDKFIAKIPSKNGFHLITKPFNIKEFGDFSNIEIHKNNPTNLYIP